MGSLCDLRVLIADDSPVSRLYTSHMLARLGITPKIVCNGAQALQLALEHELDVILMDVEMPVMDGIVATNRLREFETAHASRRRTPVVAFTASLSSKTEAALLRVGIDAVLEKPCGLLQMSECIHRVCTNHFAVPRPHAMDGAQAS